MRRLLFFFLVALSGHSFAQNSIGLSDVINYTSQTYGAGAQNWDIEQDENGILYFGNNEGLLTFDGSYWKIFRLPNKTVVRSIETGEDRRIYVGGQNEMGFFSPGDHGSLRYTSLVSLLPVGNRSFADVWNIVSYKKSIFFRASRKIMVLSADKISIYPNDDWRFLGIGNGQLIAQDHDNRLLAFIDDHWMPAIDQGILPKDFLVTLIISYSKDTALVTLSLIHI